MTRVIVIAGYGPGISDAVARRFGREGFSVALVSRDPAHLAEAARGLASAGITARPFPCDLGDLRAIPAMLGEVRASLGPVSVLHYNAYARGAGDLLTAPPGELDAVLNVCVHGLLAAVQAALPDLTATRGAVLVTGGRMSIYDPSIDATAVAWRAMGLAVAKAAQRKATGLLHHRLVGEGVYVGEVVVRSLVKGTAFDAGNATLEPADVANRFWELHEQRAPASVDIA